VCLLAPYGFRCGYLPITTGGFPHSDIPGSTPAYGSPRHFAVCRVLHRLLAPRHPPCALSSLTFAFVHVLLHARRADALCFCCYLVFKEQAGFLRSAHHEHDSEVTRLLL